MLSRDIIHGDRRQDRRYELELELRFTSKAWTAGETGLGCTLELSRGGIRFLTDTAPTDGSEVDLWIRWPFLLQNVCPLELHLSGRTLRTDHRGTVVEISGYEFRTAGDRWFDQTGTDHIFSFVA